MNRKESIPINSYILLFLVITLLQITKVIERTVYYRLLAILAIPSIIYFTYAAWKWYKKTHKVNWRFAVLIIANAVLIAMPFIP
ncbi:MAG: hypothetical protein MSD82_10415 [Prevotella sp.]|nr:hypothetical protein [Prevotella sp.]